MTTKGNSEGTQKPESLSTKLNRISEIAKDNPTFCFGNIAHLLRVEMLERAFRELKRNVAAGIDGVTYVQYEKELKSNLEQLHSRMKVGKYRAQPLRRVYIEKEDGKRRELSIPAIEDKVVQRATVSLLNRIYENDFLPCSYGYRPNRSPHDALDAIRAEIMRGKINYVLEVDIKDYFGSIVRDNLMIILRKRVDDRSLLRLIGKWLHVGAIEEGRLLITKTGVGQGTVISPLLANIYLHEVLDQWMENTVKPRMKGQVKLCRFSDDFVILFERKDDAEKVWRVISKRFEKYGLTLHAEKTKLIEFGYMAWRRGQRTGKRPQTFNFLGFTHYCGTSRRGKFAVKVKTMSKRLTRSLKRVAHWCRRYRHEPISEQWQKLSQMMKGHYSYYGRRGNSRALDEFKYQVRRIWRKWLGKRHRGNPIPWVRFDQILKTYPLPQPRISMARRITQTPLLVN